jgi:hypothetical protein
MTRYKVATAEQTGSHGNEFTRSNRGTVKNGVFYAVRVEGLSNEDTSSTVAMRVVGGDEKGSLESETVKNGHESHGTRTRE